MKKLIIRNHLGDTVFEADVYLEGQDFKHEQLSPTPIWLKEVYIVDPENVPERTPYQEPYIERRLVSATEDIPQEVKPDNPVRCRTCGWEGSTKDCQFGHDDFYCPECGKEDLIPQLCPPHQYDTERQCKICGHQEEVKPDETEATDNQGTGEQGSSETSKPEDSPKLSKKPVRKPASKRSKRA